VPPPADPPVPARRLPGCGALLALAGLGVAGYGGTAALAAGGAPAPVWWWALAAGWAVLLGGLVARRRGTERSGVLVVLVAGALFRAVLVPTPPVLSDDLYRYLWDGRVQAAGISAYRHAPAAPALAHLRDGVVWPGINRKPVRTIYPPLAQGVFAVTWRLGVRTPTAWKALVVAADVAATLVLTALLAALGKDRRHVLAYAWNPLAVLDVGQAGHLEGLVVLAVALAGLAWARGRDLPVGVWLGVAAALKLYPLLLVPAFLRARAVPSARRALVVAAVAAGVVAASYVPVAALGESALGYLTEGYLVEEGYDDGGRFRIANALGLDWRAAVPAGLAAVAWAVLRSRRPAPVRGAWLLGAAVVAATPYPWYALPVAALAAGGGAGWAWALVGAAFQIAYLSTLFGVGPPANAVRVLAGGLVIWLALVARDHGWARRAVREQP